MRIFDDMMSAGSGGRLRDPAWLARFYRGVDRYSIRGGGYSGRATHNCETEKEKEKKRKTREQEKSKNGKERTK